MGVSHHVGDDGQHLLATFAQLVLKVNIARCDERVNPSPWCRSHRFRAGLDVAFRRPRQPADHWPVFSTDLLRNALDSGEIPRTCEGKTRFNHIDAQSRQLLRDRQFLLKVETGSR